MAHWGPDRRDYYWGGSAFRDGYDDARYGAPDRNERGGGYDGWNGTSRADRDYARGRRAAGDDYATDRTPGNYYGGAGGWPPYPHSPWYPPYDW